MDDAFLGLVVGIVAFVFGMVVGASAIKDGVNGDCEKYSQYVTDEYKLTCVKK